jgi:hypothetical protein
MVLAWAGILVIGFRLSIRRRPPFTVNTAQFAAFSCVRHGPGIASAAVFSRFLTPPAIFGEK